MKLSHILLGTSVLALSACGSSSGSNGTTTADVSDIFSQTSAFSAPMDDGTQTAAQAVVSDDPNEGIVGYVGGEDGSVVAVKFRVSDTDNLKGYISLGGAPEVELTRTSLSSSGFYAGGTSVNYYDNDSAWFYTTIDGVWYEGYTGLQTTAANLPTGTVDFFGDFWLQDTDDDYAAYGTTVVDVNFDSGAISGGIAGSFFDYTGSDTDSDHFISDLSGSVNGSEFAMTSNVSTGETSGSIDFLGAFYDDGQEMAGGAAGTLNGVDMGGCYWADQEGWD